jgi:ribonuclease VapC
MSTASYLETGIVIDGAKNDELSLQLDEYIKSLDITLEPVTDFQARIARAAYRAHGKDSGSRAKLNFGDCFTYALAIETNELLLFKGGDFNHTDVRIAEQSVITD